MKKIDWGAWWAKFMSGVKKSVAAVRSFAAAHPNFTIFVAGVIVGAALLKLLG